MIEILSTQIVNYNGTPLGRHAEIIATSGGDSYLWRVGGLPLKGDLQDILDARDAELFAAAQAGGQLVEIYELSAGKVLKALAQVIMDEINILRGREGLALRQASQIETAVKNKLKDMGNE